MKFYYPAILLLLISFLPATALAQTTAVKTNLLYWGTLTPNMVIETAVSQKVSLNIGGSFNKWDFSSGDKLKKLNHWTVSAEVRFWIWEKFDGHFLGLQSFFGSYNAGGFNIPIFSKLKKRQYEGYSVGGGFTYGYQWYLGPHWNLETTVGLGYSYLNYDEFECLRCGLKYGHDKKHYFGPTKIGVSFIYLIKSRKH